VRGLPLPVPHVLFAPASSSRLRPSTITLDAAPGDARLAVVALIDRWLAQAGPGDRAGLVVVDVESDDALPFGDTGSLRRRLGRTVERALYDRVLAGDLVGRVDAGRFVQLRRELPAHVDAAHVAAVLARAAEVALVGRPEGLGVRITAGGAALQAGDALTGRGALSAVTTAMLRGKLLSDERVVVVGAVL
jgi:hypothetical protein